MAKISEKIGFIGDGNMAKAICKAIERKGLQNEFCFIANNAAY